MARVTPLYPFPMVHLRATKKVLDLMHAEPQEGEPSANALGDWFATHFVCRRKGYLLLLSSTTRLAILEEARDAHSLARRLPELVELRLAMLGVHHARIQQEIEAMGEVVVAKTNDRSTLGAMNVFVMAAGIFIEERVRFPSLCKDQVEVFLEEHLTRHNKKYIFPRDAVMAAMA